MNKAQELHALLAFIASLPHDSYLRPWLEQEVPSIERAMQGDVPLEQYCHGFEDLRRMHANLDAQAKKLLANERACAQRERDLADDKQRFASLIERVDEEAKQVQRLTAGWRKACPHH